MTEMKDEYFVAKFAEATNVFTSYEELMVCQRDLASGLILEGFSKLVKME